MAVFQNAITGFNVNIPRRGKSYHVQTEDSGVNNPHIITHLFLGGNIISTTKTSYENILGEPDLTARVKEMMEDQHKAMIRDLLDGKFDEKASHSVQLHAPKVDMLTPYQEPIKRASRSAAAPDTSESAQKKNAVPESRSSAASGDDFHQKQENAAAASPRVETRQKGIPAAEQAADPKQISADEALNSHAESVSAAAQDVLPGLSAEEQLQKAVADYFAKSRVTFAPRPSA